MIPPFHPASYPGPRPAGPVLVHRGAVYPVHLDGHAGAPVRLPDGEVPKADEVPVLAAPGEVRWSVAYGSNASPGRLVTKGMDRHGAVLLPARLLDHVPAFEHRRTGYGSVPLTLVPEPGAIVDTWVLGLPPAALDHLDLTEGRVAAGAPAGSAPQPDDPHLAPPGTYQLATVGEVAVADRFVLPVGLAYRPGPTTRVQRDADGAWRSWPTVDQRAAADHLDAGGAADRAPAVDQPILGAWPRTPFVDPSLFAYGTLRPSAAAFGLVEDLVEVVGDAIVPGELYDTGAGYPAARFGPTLDGEVHGTLLAPKDPSSAAELVRRCDRYEGLPPYERLLVRTDGVRGGAGGGAVWALAYGWGTGTPPGTRSTSGRW